MDLRGVGPRTPCHRANGCRPPRGRRADRRRWGCASCGQPGAARAMSWRLSSTITAPLIDVIPRGARHSPRPACRSSAAPVRVSVGSPPATSTRSPPDSTTSVVNVSSSGSDSNTPIAGEAASGSTRRAAGDRRRGRGPRPDHRPTPTRSRRRHAGRGSSRARPQGVLRAAAASLAERQRRARGSAARACRRSTQVTLLARAGWLGRGHRRSASTRRATRLRTLRSRARRVTAMVTGSRRRSRAREPNATSRPTGPADRGSRLPSAASVGAHRLPRRSCRASAAPRQ